MTLKTTHHILQKAEQLRRTYSPTQTLLSFFLKHFFVYR